VRQLVERHQLARAIKADQIAHPAERRNVGDGVVGVHDPLPAIEPGLEHAEQPLALGDIALQRALVLVLTAGEFVEEAELAEHRPDATHLEMQPLQGLPAPRRIGGKELSGLLGQVLQDCAGLEQAERLVAGAIGIDDRRNLAVRIEREKFGGLLVVLAEIDRMRLIR
jgi:hypothetical protein